MREFEKKIRCLITTDRFKYTCKNIHLDPQRHEINNTYRFNKGVPYLVKNKEDYDEMVNLDMFEAYEEAEEEVAEEKFKETAKEKKAREKAEAKLAKEEEKKSKEIESKPLAVPSEQTDGADSITERPEAE